MAFGQIISENDGEILWQFPNLPLMKTLRGTGHVEELKGWIEGNDDVRIAEAWEQVGGSMTELTFEHHEGSRITVQFWLAE